jgi:phosphoribosylformylglycinamidine cyclo-ligase
MLFEKIIRKKILGLIHCSGGGQTKIRNFGQPGIIYVKNNMFSVPPLFRFLQKERNLPNREMFQTYNMGHRLEAVVDSLEVADYCCVIAEEECGIMAQIIGHVYQDENNPSKRTVRIMDDEHVVHEY